MLHKATHTHIANAKGDVISSFEVDFCAQNRRKFSTRHSKFRRKRMRIIFANRKLRKSNFHEQEMRICMCLCVLKSG